jgi:hypothetical protein
MKNDSLRAERWIGDELCHIDRQQWGICDHHQAWHYHKTSQKLAESAVYSADGIRGHPFCLEGGVSGADSGVKCATNLGICDKGHWWIHPGAGCCEYTMQWQIWSTLCYNGWKTNVMASWGMITVISPYDGHWKGNMGYVWKSCGYTAEESPADGKQPDWSKFECCPLRRCVRGQDARSVSLRVACQDGWTFLEAEAHQ